MNEGMNFIQCAHYIQEDIYQGFYTIIGYAVAIRQSSTAYTDNVFRQVYITL